MSHGKETFSDAMRSVIQLLAGLFFVSLPFLSILIFPIFFWSMGYKGDAGFALGTGTGTLLFSALAWYMVAIEFFKPITATIFFAPVFFGSLFYILAWL